MRIGQYKKWYVDISWDRYGDRRFRIEVGIGYREDLPADCIRCRYWWNWSVMPPHLIRRNRKIVGYGAFGRARIFRE